MKKNLFMILCCIKLCLSEESDKNLFPTLPVAPVYSSNELCKENSVLYVESLNNLTLWAYKMWDATAKSTTGSLDGNMYHLGNWHECRQARAPFKTQYCLAQIKTNIDWLKPNEDPYTLERDPLGTVLRRILNTYDISQVPRDTANIGWCVPASCTINDLEMTLNDHLNNSQNILMQHNVTYQGKLHASFCQKQGEEKTFDMLDGTFCVISALFVFVVLVATAYEFKIRNESTEKEKYNIQKHMGRRILLGFSARKNFIDLAKPDESNPALRPLYGPRTFSIFMIIVGHRFGTFTSGPVLNLDYVEKQYRSIDGSIVFHGDLFVDTFFVLSGLLVTYGLMVQYKKKYIHPGFLIFLRYMRLTPLQAFVIFYYVTILNHIGSGPLWKLIVYQESMDCRNNWWTNLLYINNYVNEDHICMTQSWYLACDFHYFIIAVFMVLIFIKNKTLGLAIFILCFASSILVPFAIVLIYSRPGMLLFYPNFLVDPKQHTDFIMTYIKSHTRANTYCVGMIAGYIYYKLKKSDRRLSKLKSHAITLISILLLLVAVGTGGILYDPYREYKPIEHAIFAGFHRLPWAFGTIGLLITASYGHATFIRNIFSWSPFIPLSRLVYGAYLMHLGLQFRALGTTTSSQTFDIYSLIIWTFGDIVMAFVTALILYIVIETPIRKLFKELFMGQRHTVPPAAETTSNGHEGINTISRRENDSRL